MRYLLKKAEANFHKAEFGEDAIFDDVAFNNKANFGSAVFGAGSDLYFRRTLFAGKADFRDVAVNGYLRFSNLKLRDDSKFTFEDSA